MQTRKLRLGTRLPQYHKTDRGETGNSKISTMLLGCLFVLAMITSLWVCRSRVLHPWWGRCMQETGAGNESSFFWLASCRRSTPRPPPPPHRLLRRPSPRRRLPRGQDQAQRRAPERLAPPLPASPAACSHQLPRRLTRIPQQRQDRALLPPTASATLLSYLPQRAHTRTRRTRLLTPATRSRAHLVRRLLCDCN